MLMTKPIKMWTVKSTPKDKNEYSFKPTKWMAKTATMAAEMLINAEDKEDSDEK